MIGHHRLRKNERKSITERSGDLVLLAGLGERKLPDHLFQPDSERSLSNEH